MEESGLHAFFLCEKATQLWRMLPVKYPLCIENITSLEQGFEAANKLIPLPHVGVSTGALLPSVSWTLWNARNKRLFEDEVPQRSDPPPDCVQIQADASWSPISNAAGLGWVFNPDDPGNRIFGSTSMSSVSSPLMAEALAVLVAMEQAADRGLHLVSMASNSSNLIKALTEETSFTGAPWD